VGVGAPPLVLHAHDTARPTRPPALHGAGEYEEFFSILVFLEKNLAIFKKFGS
jgi:hypothetical protein